MIKILADENIPYIKEAFSRFGELTTAQGRDITTEMVKDKDILLVRSVTKVNKELLNNSKVKFVGTATIGTDHIDLEYLKNQEIVFTSAPGSNARSVCEYITVALLNLAEKEGFKLNSKKIGIVGVGNVGTRVKGMIEALGAKVILNDPPQADSTKNDIFKNIEEIKDCDIITFHVPLTKTGKYPTFNLADSKFLESIKQGTYILNSSRGHVINEDALASAIKSGKVKKYILDVWENEPTIKNESLKEAFISTPHIAGYSFNGKVNGCKMLFDALANFLKVKEQFDILLPPPPVPEMIFDNNQIDIQTALLEITSKVYDINKDSNKLKATLETKQENKAKEFDLLRKNYPIRREFHNTFINLKNAPDGLKEILKGLKFKFE